MPHEVFELPHGFLDPSALRRFCGYVTWRQDKHVLPLRLCTAIFHRRPISTILYVAFITSGSTFRGLLLGAPEQFASTD